MCFHSVCWWIDRKRRISLRVWDAHAYLALLSPLILMTRMTMMTKRRSVALQMPQAGIRFLGKVLHF